MTHSKARVGDTWRFKATERTVRVTQVDEPANGARASVLNEVTSRRSRVLLAHDGGLAGYVLVRRGA